MFFSILKRIGKEHTLRHNSGVHSKDHMQLLHEKDNEMKVSRVTGKRFHTPLTKIKLWLAF